MRFIYNSTIFWRFVPSKNCIKSFTKRVAVGFTL